MGRFAMLLLLLQIIIDEAGASTCEDESQQYYDPNDLLNDPELLEKVLRDAGLNNAADELKNSKKNIQ